MTYRKKVSHQAEKYLRNQPKQIQQRLVAAISSLPMNGDIKKLKGSSDYRLRVGDMRIIYAIDHTEKVVYIKAIDVRGEIYK